MNKPRFEMAETLRKVSKENPVDPGEILAGDEVLWINKSDDGTFTVKTYFADKDGETWLTWGEHYLLNRVARKTYVVDAVLINQLDDVLESCVDAYVNDPLWILATRVVSNAKQGEEQNE